MLSVEKLKVAADSAIGYHKEALLKQISSESATLAANQQVPITSLCESTR